MFAVDRINEDGGFVIGDTRYTFDLIVVDDRSEQDAAVQGATQLISDNGVVAIFGPIGPLGPSVAEITKSEGVLNFSSSSSVASIAGPPDYPLVFTTIASAAARVQATVDSINEFVPDVQTIGIVGPDDETAAALVPQLEEAFEGKTVTDYLYPTGTTDLSTILTRVAGDDPDVLILGWATTDRQTQGGQFAAAGIPDDTPLFLYADSIGLCQEISGGRPCIAHPLAGADLSSPSLSEASQQFVDDFLAFTNATELPGASAAILWTYDFPFIISQAMQAAESVDDPEAIADALRGGGVTREGGLIGTVTYDDANKAVHGFDISLVDGDTITTEHFE
jgi:ABC-type branched-subunit amino acid transport system substrate-binding protein